VSGGITPFKFYSSKALEFLKQDLSFDKPKFLRFVDDNSLDLEDNNCRLLKLHVSETIFPKNFKQAFESIFKFLDILFNTNSEDVKKLKALFQVDKIKGVGFLNQERSKFNLHTAQIFLNLENILRDKNIKNFQETLLLRELFYDFRNCPQLYQESEYKAASSIVTLYQDDQDNLYKKLLDFFKLIRPYKYNAYEEITSAQTIINNKSYYLPKNNFYFWMNDFENLSQKLSDYFHKRVFRHNSSYIYLDHCFNIINNDDKIPKEKKFFVLRDISKIPDHSEPDEREDFVLANCYGYVEDGQFYENPSAIEIKTPK